jgi:hypothetical protein
MVRTISRPSVIARNRRSGTKLADVMLLESQ